MIRKHLFRVGAFLAALAAVLGIGVSTAGTASAGPNVVGFYAAVVSDYRAHTGRIVLYSARSVTNAGSACYHAITDRDKKIPFDRAAWAVAGYAFNGDLALARATCAQALRFGIK